MKSLNYSKGFSAWVLLPWLLFLTLAFVFWWFVNEKGGGTVEPVTTAQIAPAEIAPPTPAKLAEVTPQTAQISTTPVVSYHEAVKTAAVSVVNIYTTQKVNNPYSNDPMLRQFLEFHGYAMPQNDEATSLGSGVIVSNDGYIVTNAHVIDKADEIIVVLHDGRKAKASVIGADVESDLAVIKVELTSLTPINFKKGDVQVGDITLAIGNPFGVGQTVTQGIVSATGRTGIGSNTFEDFIQTDAAINPGNSGGALVDAYGELLGINTMIYSRSGGSMGIGFAIKGAVVEKVMNDLIQGGVVHRGWLGIEVGSMPINPASLDEPKGVLVASVGDNSPAQAGGLLPQDVILAVDGTPVNNANTLIQMIAQKSPDSVVSLEIEREGKPVKLDVVLAQRPSFGKKQTQLPSME